METDQINPETDRLRERMAAELYALGVREGDVLLVHASLRALGSFPSRAQVAVEALKTVLGESGTLLMPALSYATVGREHPFFSALKTPSCVGALPEYFRTCEGVVRSLHPTHSVSAWGKLADDLTGSHALDHTPVGPHSPFALLPRYAGKILMLGCGLLPDTSMHGVEELVEPPYLFKKEPVSFTLRDAQGRISTAWHRVHDFAGYAQRYDRVAGLLTKEELRSGRVLGADCFLIEARALWREAEKELRKNPFCFVDPSNSKTGFRFSSGEPFRINKMSIRDYSGGIMTSYNQRKGKRAPCAPLPTRGNE